jgi:hypothetical protein
MITAQIHIILSILFIPLWDIFFLVSVDFYTLKVFLNCVLKQKLCHYRFQV